MSLIYLLNHDVVSRIHSIVEFTASIIWKTDTCFLCCYPCFLPVLLYLNLVVSDPPSHRNLTLNSASAHQDEIRCSCTISGRSIF